jgi:release factor glutamine methyltransferase
VDKTKKPIEYRCGVAHFCELPFFVNKNTLIPRYDTETLVEAVILDATIQSKNGRADLTNLRALDLCTGSGCVAVILAQHGFNVTAVDISKKALKIARKNTRLHGVKVSFLHSDLLKSIQFKGENRRGGGGGNAPLFDIIVCNPPYIKTAEIGKFDEGTLFEPRLALDGGADGLDFYRQIVKNCNVLKKGGKIFFEIDHRAVNDVKNILQTANFRDIKIARDKQGHERVIYAVKN